MNIWIAVAPPMVADLLEEFAGNYAVGHWLNPPGLEVIDIIGITNDGYLEIKARPGVTIWGAWNDDGTSVENKPNIIDIVPDIVARDQDGNETGRTRPLVFSQVHKWLGQSDREV